MAALRAGSTCDQATRRFTCAIGIEETVVQLSRQSSLAGVAGEPSRSPDLPRDGLLGGGPEPGGGLRGESDLRPLLPRQADDGRDPEAGQELPVESMKSQA